MITVRLGTIHWVSERRLFIVPMFAIVINICTAVVSAMVVVVVMFIVAVTLLLPNKLTCGTFGAVGDTAVTVLAESANVIAAAAVILSEDHLGIDTSHASGFEELREVN